MRDEDRDEEENELETTALDELADFSTVTVWGHEQPPDDEEDMITRGVAEWIRFAETVSYWELTIAVLWLMARSDA